MGEDPNRTRQMSALTEFLFPAPARRTTGAIFAWWERRRLAYNAWVGAAGLVSLGTFATVTALLGSSSPGRYVWVPVLIFGTMANVLYLLGPMAELLTEKLWGRQVLPTGPVLFRMGLTFSVGLALFPALLSAIALLVSAVVRIFVAF